MRAQPAGVSVDFAWDCGGEAVRERLRLHETAHFDDPGYPRLHFVEQRYANDPTNWWVPNRACAEGMLRASGFEIIGNPEDEVFICRRTTNTSEDRLAEAGSFAVVEAVMLWNEPNNLSHWDFELDPDWTTFGRMVREAGAAMPPNGRN